MTARLLLKDDGTPVARAQAWDMGWFSREDERTRIGLINLEVAPEHRRKGFGRFLVSEILRRTRDNMIAAVAVATSAANQPALATLCFSRFSTNQRVHALSTCIRRSRASLEVGSAERACVNDSLPTVARVSSPASSEGLSEFYSKVDLADLDVHVIH